MQKSNRNTLPKGYAEDKVSGFVSLDYDESTNTMTIELDGHHEFDLLNIVFITNVPVYEKTCIVGHSVIATCYNSDFHNTSVLPSRPVTNILLTHLLHYLGVFYMDALAQLDFELYLDD